MEQSGLLASVRRHPLLSYFGLAFALAWTWVLIVVLPSGFPGSADAVAALFPVAFAGMALAPPVAGIALTAILDGRSGLQSLGRGLTRWRIAPRYYLLALGLVPLCVLLVLGARWVLAPGSAPLVLGAANGLPFVAGALAIGLLAGWLEEIGWTGFALPRLLGRHGVLITGLVLGALHGAWHVVAGVWGEGAAYGSWFPLYFLLFWMLGLVGLRLLIAWLYERTRSVLIAQLTHASYTGGLMALWPTSLAPAENTLWTAVFAVLLLALGLFLAGYGRRRTVASAAA